MHIRSRDTIIMHIRSRDAILINIRLRDTITINIRSRDTIIIHIRARDTHIYNCVPIPHGVLYKHKRQYVSILPEKYILIHQCGKFKVHLNLDNIDAIYILQLLYI